jgi:hypothetical protein
MPSLPDVAGRRRPRGRREGTKKENGVGNKQTSWAATDLFKYEVDLAKHQA